MSQSKLDWQIAKADSLIRHYIEREGKSDCPSIDLCSGLIEMAYATDMLNDERYGYWTRRLELTVQHRRLELREKKHSALFELPGIVGGELIAGGLHGNG